jgi:hypothetical protein
MSTRNTLHRSRRLSIVSLALVATGCAQVPPRVVEVQVPVRCSVDVPDRPASVLPDAALIRLTDEQLILALREQQILWRDHARELAAALRGCRQG